MTSSGEAYRKEPKRAPNSDWNSASDRFKKKKAIRVYIQRFNLTSREHVHAQAFSIYLALVARSCNLSIRFTVRLLHFQHFHSV